MKKYGLNIPLIVFGICLVAAGFLIRDESLKAVSGILIGVGCGLCGMSFAKIVMIRYEDKNPGIKRQREIDLKDERSEAIRNKAMAKAGSIIQWFIIGIAYVLILIDAPLWVILAVVAVYVLYYGLEFYFLGKYQAEM